MVSKKWVGGTLAFASAFILILVILLTTIEQSAFDRNFFQSEYKKLNQTEVIGISEEDLMLTTEVLLDYIQGKRDNLSVIAVIQGEKRSVFNEREIAHMVDVQSLYAHTLVFRNVGVVLLFLLLLLLRFVMGKGFFRFWAGGYLLGHQQEQHKHP